MASSIPAHSAYNLAHDRLAAAPIPAWKDPMKNFLALLVMAVVGLAGCHNGGTKQNSTNMRTLNAVVDAEPLDVLVDSDVKFSAVAPNTVTGYSNFDSGTRDLQARSSTNQSILLDQQTSFGSDATGTLLLYGHRSTMKATFVPDDTTQPSSGHARIRAIGLAPDSGPVDVYLTPTNISAGPPILTSVTFGATSTVTEVPAGTYNIIITTAGTQEILFSSTTTVSVGGNDNDTIAIMPTLGGKLVNAAFLQSGTNGTAVVLTNPLARLKAVNGLTDTTVNFKLDGNPFLSNVPFAASSTYLTLSSGSHTVSAEAANVPGTSIASVTSTLSAGRDYSAVTAGTGASPRMAVLTDDNSLPNAGFAKIRFVNALADDATVDVLLNFAQQATAIPSIGASSYYQVAAGTNYTISFTTPGGITVIASLQNVELDAGNVYSAYLFGTSSSAQVRLVRDR